MDYFQSQFPRTTIVFDISLVYIAASLASVLANNALVHRLSLRTRILFGYAVSLATLCFVAVFEVRGPSSSACSAGKTNNER